MQRKIAITGATGFVGRHLISRLAQKDDIISIARRGDATILGDITQTHTAKDIYAHNPDTIIHLAAANEGDMQTLFAANVVGTLNLFSHAPPSVKKIILISSYAVYGSSNAIHKEDDIPAPDTEYGFTKHIAEQIAAYYCRKKHIPLIILRPGTIYGSDNNKGVVRAFIDQLDAGQIAVTGDGSQARSMVHCDDVVDAIATVLEHEEQDCIFNVAEGHTTVLELAKIIIGISEKGSIRFVPIDSAKPGNLMISSDKLIARGYWRPKIPLRKGIDNIIKTAVTKL